MPLVLLIEWYEQFDHNRMISSSPHFALVWFLQHNARPSQCGILLQCSLLSLSGSNNSQKHSHSHAFWTPSWTRNPSPTCSFPWLLALQLLQSMNSYNSCHPKSVLINTNYDIDYPVTNRFGDIQIYTVLYLTNENWQRSRERN